MTNRMKRIQHVCHQTYAPVADCPECFPEEETVDAPR